MQNSEYCRELESYLCHKNEGHLIRIVGPAFERVCGWAEQGVPLAVAKKGIDQYCERYYAKGPRRRPVRIEFCEADILDLFDAWRRAVGVAAEGGGAGETSQGRDSLPSHLERAIARLTSQRTGVGRSERFDAALAEAVRELDTMRAAARNVRGHERTLLLERLSALDARLTAAAIEEIDDETARAMRTDAQEDIAPFAARMTAADREAAASAAFERRVRDAAGLPVLAFE